MLYVVSGASDVAVVVVLSKNYYRKIDFIEVVDSESASQRSRWLPLHASCSSLFVVFLRYYFGFFLYFWYVSFMYFDN